MVSDTKGAEEALWGMPRERIVTSVLVVGSHALRPGSPFSPDGDCRYRVMLQGGV